jgi:hypothetical protein
MLDVKVLKRRFDDLPQAGIFRLEVNYFVVGINLSISYQLLHFQEIVIDGNDEGVNGLC